MGPLSIWTRIWLRIEALPIILAYRIVWLAARLGSDLARDVHAAMWDANLSVPPLTDPKGLSHE